MKRTLPQMADKTVAITRSEGGYPAQSPFHPADAFPEYPFAEHLISSEPNPAYSSVRESLRLLGLDRDNFGTKAWNPLGELISPGMTVVLKPNFVLSRHKQGKDLFSIITHPSILRAVADYCWIALQGAGKIIIADAPQYDCNFGDLIEALGLDVLCAFYARHGSPTVEYRDLRDYWSRARHFPSMVEPLPGDPMGKILFDLGADSAFCGKGAEEHLYGAVYHRSETIQSHSDGRHQYEISGTILRSDVVISCPKLKVHKKVGVTLNAKGLVGIATNKNYLVHYTLGTPEKGGDQFPDGFLTRSETALITLERWMYDHLLAPRVRTLEYLHRSIYWLHNSTLRRCGLKVAEWKRNLDAGNWHGNDSAWRMTVDLMRILYFGDAEGHLTSHRQRRLFSVIDGIVGGENNGPLTPDPVASGVVLAGAGLLATDVAATALMGFDPNKLKLYQHLLGDPRFRFEINNANQVPIVSNVPCWNATPSELAASSLRFRAHPGWTDQIEWDSKPGSPRAEETNDSFAVCEQVPATQQQISRS